MIDVLLSKSMMTLTVAPKAAKIAADQNTSPQSAGMNNKPPILLPNISWKGSNIVTYPCSLILLAKKNPPKRKTSSTFLP